ncbi:NAD(P)H-hydrate dehydratase [Paenalcaligenes sp.]|uniref:NAD(P)H-hydrate dehydratase n=1 Tax=Paenalcaligenes sp. TaxID=1966342 RepID=UPI00262B076D|nr:NAD(P)H-hydrate dehydratase [Paenalcaligenes sp.]
MMDSILDTEQMYAADRAAIARGISAYSLIDRAGVAAAEQIHVRWPTGKILVLCGPGNNGGDGYRLASQLHRWGRAVRVMEYAPQRARSAEAQAHREQCLVALEPLDETAFEAADIVVDALLGMGLQRPLSAALQTVLQSLQASSASICAIDVPTGIDGNGRCWAEAPLQAALTITFFRKKLAHVLAPSRFLCGEIKVVDIGLCEEDVTPPSYLYENQPALWQSAIPSPQPLQHKYQRGAALVYGGSEMTGAARLSALACARAGAGATTIACASDVWAIYAQSMQSVMVKRWHSLSQAAALSHSSTYQTVLIGPGLAPEPSTQELVMRGLLQTQASSWVVDAGALTAFASQPESLFEGIHTSAAQVVLTPHEGEFARLFPDLALHSNQKNKVERARQAAARSGAIVLLKGSDTVVASPDGRAAVQTQSSPYLASAGSGDVLAGMMTGLLAQGMSPWLAANMAVWMHSQAGLILGAGLIAEDLVQSIPTIWQQIGRMN